MADTASNINPKKRNRYTSSGLLEPGIRRVREARKRLFEAQRRGEPEERLDELRAELKKMKLETKKGA
jgi:hypothetical protein